MSYITAGATPKPDKKTSKMVFSLTEIALMFFDVLTAGLNDTNVLPPVSGRRSFCYVSQTSGSVQNNNSLCPSIETIYDAKQTANRSSDSVS